MSGNIFRRILHWGKDCKYRSLMLGIVIGSCVLAVILLVTDQREATKSVTSIPRESSGHGSITKELQLIVNGIRQKDKVRITVQERNYSDEELQKVIRSGDSKNLVIESLDRMKNLDNVRYDLNLIKEIPDVPVRVEWEVDRYDVISVYGVLNEENLMKEPEGVLVNLKACLIYKQDETKRAITEMTVKIYPPLDDNDEKTVLLVTEELRKQEESSRQKSEFKIPTQIDGNTIDLFDYTDMDYTDRVKDCTVDAGAYERKNEDMVKPDDKGVYYVTFNGNGTADASSPANAACAMKLQEVLNAAGQRVTEGNTAIVKIAGYESYTTVYHSNTLANPNDPKSYTFVIPEGVTVMGGYNEGSYVGGIYQNDGKLE